jgi:predicted ATPase
MISTITIQNYKSIVELTIPIGHINVLIGENGCGKSNILEAITLLSAATQNKLDNEFLVSRGIRVTRPELMRSAFEIESTKEDIILSWKADNYDVTEILTNDNTEYSTWGKKIVPPDETQQTIVAEADDSNKGNINKDEIIKIIANAANTQNTDRIVKIIEENPDKNIELIALIAEAFATFTIEKIMQMHKYGYFLIYSPENTALRNFAKEGQIEPLGIYGEGLFKLIRYMSKHTPEKITEIKSYLELFGWFEDFDIPNGLFSNESVLHIKDKYIASEIDYFDQRSSNEGFLFVLFYLVLVISDKTPSFFAIDNIEAALNPKLCAKLITCLAELSKKYDKQVIVTTHNPALLDGLDLSDDQQKLYTVYRNKLGHTKINRISKPTPLAGEPATKLSELFMRGAIGGLPKNF